jgi:polyisoprenoid-binding protein YceI
MLQKSLIAVALLVALLAATAPAPVKYEVDVNHSNVGFSIPIMGGLSRVSGKFTDFAVQIVYDEADITKSSVNATIKTASIDTGIEKRDAHLRTADFFDAEKYPEITFQSRRVERRGNQLMAHGIFTMHGVSKEVSIPFTITGKHTNPANQRTNIGISARLTINRQDYGITWRHRSVPNFVGDEVEIEINLITRVPSGQ